MNDFRTLVESLRALEVVNEGVEGRIRAIINSGDEEQLIDAMSGLMGDDLRDALEEIKENMLDGMSSGDIDDVIDDQDALAELMMDYLVKEYDFDDSSDGESSEIVSAGFNPDGSYNTSDDEANEFDELEADDEEAVESTDLKDRVHALREKLSQFKDTYLKEFGADNGPAPTGQMDPDQLKTQNTIKANLNQLKSAGVNIDPNKGLDDPENAGEIGAKVQAAMADPAMANQVKSVLQRIKN
jgi:hypothetical protein